MTGNDRGEKLMKKAKVILTTVVVLALLSGVGVLAAIVLSEMQSKNDADSVEFMPETPIEVVSVSEEPEPEPIEEGFTHEERAELINAASKTICLAFRTAWTKADSVAQAEFKAKAEEEARKKAEEEAKKKAEEEAARAKAAEEALKQTGEDTKAPVFLYYRANPKIKQGDTFNVHSFIGYADDVDRNVDLNVQGSVDTSTLGTYNLTITITDDVGHSTTKNMEVKVITAGGGGGGTGEDNPTGKEQFSDFIANYKNENTMLGIDVSRWQGDIDFQKCKNAGCEFVYMRLGGYDEKEHYTDRYYVQNMSGALAAGMKVGIYWHAEESGPEEIKASVKYLMGVLNGQKLDFPIAYDWEDYKNFENYGMNLQDLNNLLVYFEQEVESYGYKACLYGSKNAQNTIWTKPKKNPVWLAQYNTSTNYEGEYFMWQHSSTGRIDGIAGDVDLDVYYPNKY